MSILETLRGLEAKLERELRGNAIYKELLVIRRAIADLAGGDGARPAGQSALTAQPNRQGNRNRRAALDACFEHLEGRAEPVRTADLDRYLETRQIRLNGSKPISNLSAALGKDLRFEKVGTKGWRQATPKEQNRETSGDRPGERSDDADELPQE